MSTGAWDRSLIGRHAETELLDGLLEAARGGKSRALVVRGEAGVGKTALLNDVVARASGFRTARAAGVQSEMELAFAGLHQLCAPLLDRLERLPDPQRTALSTAFGLSAGEASDRFFVGLAVLGLLSEVAEEQPLLCAVDDAQWLDQSSIQVLAFVARRLEAESVVFLFADREPGTEELANLSELRLRGLTDAHARELLASVITGRLDEQVRERIITETHGNALALLELPHGLSPAELAGGFRLPEPRPLPGRIETSFLRRVEQLPGETQRLLLTAAAEPTGDPGLLWRAAAELGIPQSAVTAAENGGLLEVTTQVTFRHSLLRSAIYSAAPPEERRSTHRALANATDREADPDRHAWHLAQATSAPDQEVADQLELSAGRAQARGGFAAAAAFLERAAALSPEPAAQAARALAAAEAKHRAGVQDAALQLLIRAEAGPLDELQRARAEQIRAQIAFVERRGEDAARLLLSAARRLAPLDRALARATYLEAMGAAFVTSDNAELLELAQEVLAAAPASRANRAPDLLLDGMATAVIEGISAGKDLLRRAVIAFRSQSLTREEEIRGLWFAGDVASALWDEESFYALCARYVSLTRDTGALTGLVLALNMQAMAQIQAGEFAAAGTVLEEAIAITRATGNAPVTYAPPVLAAWANDEGTALDRIESALREATRASYEEGIRGAEYASAVLYNGLGRFRDAVDAAERSCAHHPLNGFPLVLIELIEAAARSGDHERAATSFERFSDRASLSDTDWALGVETRLRALVSGSDRAEKLYLEAIERLGRTRIRTELARAHLVYGEWLRRANRRLEARKHLRTAHDLFSAMGAEAFTDRAARELLATGETVRKRNVEHGGGLTAQESQIARLACDGLSNPEIGARLFISRRTVEYHLHKVFTKLEISSRNQLHRALGSDPSAALPGGGTQKAP